MDKIGVISGGNVKSGSGSGNRKVQYFKSPPPLKLLLTSICTKKITEIKSLISHISTSFSSSSSIDFLHSTSENTYITVTPAPANELDFLIGLQKFFNGMGGMNGGGIIGVEKCWDQKSYESIRSGNRNKAGKLEKMNNTIENDDDWKDFESRLSSDGQSLKRAVEVEKINVEAVGSDNRSSLVKYLSSRIGNIEKQERKREAKERSRKEIRMAKERIGGEEEEEEGRREGG
ncbi:hypothetical protein TL16_g05863 [Triparma laevis f. inornata]|uniref:Uncharacterized protein n=1 Tax=Triparma laevis f. inornata TaxID=1714386 RepID=A0A9W7E8F7_9STRA|nr:hypothetical protein TL16_g05863 [Triparma laevis f. inornata]